MKKEKIGAVVVGAGASQRFGGTDKLLAPLAGKPVLAHTLAPFLELRALDSIVLVLSRRNIVAVKDMLAARDWAERVTTCLGGKRRQDSVYAGFKKLGKMDWVVVHDAARPLVTTDMIERGLEAARETGAAIAAVPTTDTIKLADKSGTARWTMPRDGLYNCQTPQVFLHDVLERAFEYVEQDVTDEAQLVELTGGRVKLFTGACDNIKITTPADLAIASALIKLRKAR